MKYHVVTYGCAANIADSQRIDGYYKTLNYQKTSNIGKADMVIINTCMVRQSAEDRIYGLVHNLNTEKLAGRKLKIIVTGCMTGMIIRDKSGKLERLIRNRMPGVDEFLPIEEIGFEQKSQRPQNGHAYVPISNGCNNFCTFCVVPFSRGREISRPYEEIVNEAEQLALSGYKNITLLGQNVNSYGADLLLGEKNVQVMRDLPDKKYFDKFKIKNAKVKITHLASSGQANKKLKLSLKNKITYVKHLGKLRIPTLFPQLLEEICKIDGLEKIDFLSSNPWDFSDDLINVIVRNPKISRKMHIALQSGDNQMLKKMNRWYTAGQFLHLLNKLRARIPDVKISTDIIVGFCGETDKQFQNTLALCRKAKFYKAYISMYSDRHMTAAHKVYLDDVSYLEKKRRWQILENLINK